MMRSQFGPLQYAEGGPAERAAQKRMEEEPYYDPALAARVSRLLGPGFQFALDPRKKRYIKTESPLNLAGLYRYKDAPEDEEGLLYPYGTTRYGANVVDILKRQPDTVYAFGPTPEATTLAHEFRHRAGVHDEYLNRLYDGLYAETPEDWKTAVHYWRDRLKQYDYRDKELTDEQAEHELVSTLQRLEKRLREEEYDMAPEGQKPRVSEPSLGGFLLGAPYEYMVHGPAPYRKFVPPEKKSRGGLASLR